MSMTVRRSHDIVGKTVLVSKVADIRGGVSVYSSELGGAALYEGTVISRPDNQGICHVIKTAKVTAKVEESGKTIKVAKGSHFKAGDFVFTAENSKAAKITAIDRTDKTADKLTLDGAVGAIEAGGYIAEAKEASTDASSLRYEPFAIIGTGKKVLPGDNLTTDAWVLGVTKGNEVPEFVNKALKGIVSY